VDDRCAHRIDEPGARRARRRIESGDAAHAGDHARRPVRRRLLPCRTPARRRCLEGILRSPGAPPIRVSDRGADSSARSGGRRGRAGMGRACVRGRRARTARPPHALDRSRSRTPDRGRPRGARATAGRVAACAGPRRCALLRRRLVPGRSSALRIAPGRLFARAISNRAHRASARVIRAGWSWRTGGSCSSYRPRIRSACSRAACSVRSSARSCTRISTTRISSMRSAAGPSGSGLRFSARSARRPISISFATSGRRRRCRSRTVAAEAERVGRR